VSSSLAGRAKTAASSTGRPSIAVVAGVGVSFVPLLILLVPVVLRLPAVEPLLHESDFYPSSSRVSLVTIPLLGLVVVNLGILAATRSLRSVLVTALITSVLALVLVLDAVEVVDFLDQPVID
jgi:hypothetical protein